MISLFLWTFIWPFILLSSSLRLYVTLSRNAISLHRLPAIVTIIRSYEVSAVLFEIAFQCTQFYLDLTTN